MDLGLILLAINSAIFSNFALLYIVSKLVDKNLFANIKHFILCYLFLIIFSSGMYLVTNNLLRILLYYLILIPVCKIMFSEKLYKIICSTFLAYVLMAASEMLTAIILIFFQNGDQYIFHSYTLNVFVNIIIFTFGILMAENKKLIDVLKRIISLLDNVMMTKVLVASVIGIFLVFFILFCSYFRLSTIYLLVTDFLFLCCYIYIIYIYFKEINLNVVIKKEYDDLLVNVNEYERIYNIQKMIAHEHKNQLLTIKSLVNKKDKKLMSYVDGIISSDLLDDNEWFNKLNFIPNGGIRGILYYKILEMKEKKINVDFIISKNINAKIMADISLNTNINLCKILGVILDNAIEALKNEKEKNISIEFYCNENKVVIAISNNYSGNVEFSKMGIKQFSTKGENHGYGLRLVKYLVNQDDNLENQKEINGNIFTQLIKIRA